MNNKLISHRLYDPGVEISETSGTVIYHEPNLDQQINFRLTEVLTTKIVCFSSIQGA